VPGSVDHNVPEKKEKKRSRVNTTTEKNGKNKQKTNKKQTKQTNKKQMNK